MKIRLFSIFIFTVFFYCGYAQDLNSEIGFKYVKADYLIKTQRYEEALKELNEIINENPAYNNVLFLRADLRFKSGDYPGARSDALKAIESKGITGEITAILGRCDFALNNKEAAEQSLETAVRLGINEEKVLIDYASLLFEKKSTEKACSVWQVAAKRGSSIAAINLSKHCGANTPSIVTNTSESNTITNNPDTVNNKTSPKVDTKDDQNTNTNDEPSQGKNDVFNFPVPEEDNTVNDIVIDEDLTISLYGQGLGKRKILEKPSILILSEKDGEVVIEICINENGRVETAEFIADKSTIDNKGLVSLALRKSKDFWFEKSDFRKQCGYIVYKVKGS